MGNNTPSSKKGSDDDILSYVELKERGRITIPSKIRKDRGWEPGNHLMFVKRNCFLLTPANIDDVINTIQNNGKDNIKKQLKDAMGERILVYQAVHQIVDKLPPK